MSMGKIETKEVPAILDSESMAILHALEANAKTSPDFEAHMKEKLAKKAYLMKRSEQAIEGPTDDLEYPGGPPRMNPNESVYGQAVSAAGAISPSNVVGGIAPLLALGLPLLPGLIGAIGSVIPGIVNMFRRKPAPVQRPPPPSQRRPLPARTYYEERDDEGDGDQEDPERSGSGAIRPANWGIGSGEGGLSALVGAGERITSALEG